MLWARRAPKSLTTRPCAARERRNLQVAAPHCNADPLTATRKAWRASTSVPHNTRALARRAKEAGLHVCVETCGCCRRDDLLAVAANTDLFLFDYKLPPALYPQYTGARAEGILENLSALSQAGASAILRCPILPGINDNDAHCDGIAAVARRERCVERVELMPYHPLGLGKAQRMDMPLAYQNPDFLRGDALADFAARIEAAADKPVRVN